ncbi:LysR family transcriptional regulator [Rhizobium sp. BE258]|uniref:LysR family transcriptional regulator n=1 Tax=Rhizobium sp. BE258 TaxID=2817722 RepID=UPI000DDAA682|nr:LysR family transcriptional regulator [Rhizobium sp. BE258]MDR7144812.1 DNA-binding transcriptional LysR family regulator [Rhizobium sp. BE258]
MNSLDWTLVRSFLAVVECGSLSKAAKSIAATQPTLSRHVRELEAELGISLFTRSVQGLDPTAAALGLIEDARAMGAAAEALNLKAQGRSQQLSGTVRVTASVIVGNLILPALLATLRQAEPNIQIEIVTSDANQNLLRRDADIAIRMAEPTQNALIARKLGDTPMGLFGAKGYFDRRGRVTSVADLHSHDLIGLDRSDVLIRGLAAYEVKLARDDFVLRSDDQMVGWHLLLAGGGIGIAQVLLASRYSELEQVDVGLQFRPLPVWLVMSEEVRSSARVRRVADFLSDALIDVLRG